MPRLRDKVDDWVDAIMNLYWDNEERDFSKSLEKWLRQEFNMTTPKSITKEEYERLTK